MKKFDVELKIKYEGYSGYDKKTTENWSVDARNNTSALNKAKKLSKKDGYLRHGWLASSQTKEVEA